MKVSYLVLISIFIVGALFVPAVSATTITVGTVEIDSGSTQQILSGSTGTSSTTSPFYIVSFKSPNAAKIEQITVYTMQKNRSSYKYDDIPAYFACTANLTEDGQHVGTADISWSKEDFISEPAFLSGSYAPVFLSRIIFNWNDGYVSSGSSNINIVPIQDTWYKNREWYTYMEDGARIDQGTSNVSFKVYYVSHTYGPSKIFFAGEKFRNDYEIESNENEIILQIDRPAGYINESRIAVYRQGELIRETAYSQNSETYYFTPSADRIDIIPADSRFTASTIYKTQTEDPTPTPTEEPGDQHVLRTGSVTMTDHNGTSISGFEVTAVNAYTGQSYNVSTDTGIAIMNLPMDRTIEIRNPQTGEYETAPIGYYKFYGYAPGYKMLNEEGIRISVMPEKYTSYQICDILVTPESGYLTGKHQFQLRSRSDNSILQTGTISAQSATTNQWYNTSVTNGIATLILPYDTSNPISEYAGNYYVYATSPGYEDSDYGTQIVVMPHTVSEINTILLTPIGGVPTAGNVTLRIQAFSEYGPGVPNAQIFIAGVLGAGSSVWNTYTASSTGYLEVSVPGNSTYDIVASAEGYYDSARRIEVFTEPPGLIEIKLYLSGAPTVEPTTQPTGWPTTHPTTQPTGGIPDDDNGSESFLMQAVRGIGKAFGVGFSTAKLIFGMFLALSIGFATAKHLRGGAAEFGLGLVGGTMLGVLIGLLPVWTVVVLLLIVGLYIGNRYIGGGNNG